MTRVLSKSEEKEEEVENESEKYHSEEFFSNPFLDEEEEGGREKYPILEILLAALRKSLLTCGVEREEFCSMDIGRPTNVKHVSHVTFDRFNGFLGLPLEFQPDLPIRVPSASARVFGVSAKSMQCSYDHRGNSVPTILLLMQRRLYSQGGLQAEGIFRINAENSQEEYVRDQLNIGIVPHGIDVHCLAGLIKAWFRELPTGVLDSLTPDQVMHCNNEEDCSQLVRTLPSTEAALLDWAINLMADVVHHEDVNKMNSRNIAMVFAPNMTQMADPLTALIHAVQVMNFLKTLIIKTQREREESTIDMREMSICSDSPSECDGPNSPLKSTSQMCGSILSKTLSASDRSESEVGESFRSFQAKSEVDEECGLIRGANSPPAKNTSRSVESEECSSGYVEGYMDLLSLRRGVRKLCRHPVFQFSKPDKKSGGDLQIVNSGERGAWA